MSFAKILKRREKYKEMFKNDRQKVEERVFFNMFKEQAKRLESKDEEARLIRDSILKKNEPLLPSLAW